jgi:hypothetical protein
MIKETEFGAKDWRELRMPDKVVEEVEKPGKICRSPTTQDGSAKTPAAFILGKTECRPEACQRTPRLSRAAVD